MKSNLKHQSYGRSFQTRKCTKRGQRSLTDQYIQAITPLYLTCYWWNQTKKKFQISLEIQSSKMVSVSVTHISTHVLNLHSVHSGQYLSFDRYKNNVARTQQSAYIQTPYPRYSFNIRLGNLSLFLANIL